MANITKTQLVLAAILLILLVNSEYCKSAFNGSRISSSEDIREMEGLEYLWMGADQISRMLGKDSPSSNALDKSNPAFKRCTPKNPRYCLPGENQKDRPIYCNVQNRDHACRS